MNTLKQQKDQITKALKSIVVPQVNTLGFSGTFPHYRRIRNGRYEFLSFQFNRHGGSFVVETGFTTPDLLLKWEKKLPFVKLNYGNTRIENRSRIHPGGLTEDFWFDYAKFNRDDKFESLAQSVAGLLQGVDSFLQNKADRDVSK